MGFRPLEIDGRFVAAPTESVSFEGKGYSARAGEPLGVTLLAHGIYVLSRSPKYHRPRGLFCGRGSCGNCLAQVDGRANVRLCTAPASVGHAAEIVTQNVLGTAKHDVLHGIDWLFKGGLDHHHMMTRSLALNRLAVRMARKLAGLGELPREVRVEGQPPERRAVDVVVVGAGPAGRAAAEATRARGLDTVLADALPGAGELWSSAPVLGLYDDRELLVVRGDKLWRLEARAIVLATGTYDPPPPWEGNDLPGVFARRAAELILEHGVLPGRRLVVGLHAPDADGAAELRAAALALVAKLAAAGATIVAAVGGLAPSGVASRAASPVALLGTNRLTGVRLADGSELDCDGFVHCAPGAPAFELARQMGLETRFVVGRGFVPAAEDDGRTARRGLYLAGEVTGRSRREAAEHGERVGAAVASELSSLS